MPQLNDKKCMIGNPITKSGEKHPAVDMLHIYENAPKPENMPELTARLRAAGILPKPAPADTTFVVDEETGGVKGQKLARFDMIPPDVLWELAEHYGRGEAKYPSDETGLPNWQRGYSWRLSVAALLRHFYAFLQGEDVDPENGSSHLIAVIWHAMALRYFQLHGKGKDHRGNS
jgi:hypothetical protein